MAIHETTNNLASSSLKPAGTGKPKAAKPKKSQKRLDIVVDPRKGTRISIVIKGVTATQKGSKVNLDKPKTGETGDPEPDRNSSHAIVIRIQGTAKGTAR